MERSQDLPSSQKATIIEPHCIAFKVTIFFKSGIYYRNNNSDCSHISNVQQGFMNILLNTSNLFIIMQYISEILDSNNGQVDVVHTEFAKTFERIDWGF